MCLNHDSGFCWVFNFSLTQIKRFYCCRYCCVSVTRCSYWTQCFCPSASFFYSVQLAPFIWASDNHPAPFYFRRLTTTTDFILNLECVWFIVLNQIRCKNLESRTNGYKNRIDFWKFTDFFLFNSESPSTPRFFLDSYHPYYHATMFLQNI
jgi:hypothetical protein